MSLDVENITVERAGRLVIKGLSLKIDAGEACILRGPNGVGKSTLLRALAGLLPISLGDVLWDGTSCLDGRRTDLADKIGYMGHMLGLKASLTSMQWLSSSLWLDGRHTSEGYILEALEAVHLRFAADVPVRVLSSGQRQRLALCRLKLLHRRLWLLDEPSVGLDDAALHDLQRMIHHHLQDGGLVLATSHVELGIAAKAYELRRCDV
ncbi:MAG: heme ABC exporter ATP-binding protein CcmA [Alphaproteobacteria bacterium]|jgi:heme exporter protein A|nr:heme ABC exporter ATP-binding protein CcmA [Alphaproteobacteria bacterium]